MIGWSGQSGGVLVLKSNGSFYIIFAGLDHL